MNRTDRSSARMALVGICLSFFMVILDTTVVNIALPAIQANLGDFAGLAPVVRQCVHAGLCEPAADRRRPRRSVGAEARLHGRACPLHRGVRRLQLCVLPPGFGGRTHRARRGGGGADARLALADRPRLPRPPRTGARHRHLGRHGRRRRLQRPGPGRPAGGRVRLAEHLPHQHSRRPHGDRPHRALRRADQGRSARALDPIGQVLAVVALAAFTYGLIEGPEHGWASPGILAAFLTAVAAALLFIAAERRGGGAMIPLDLFRSRPLPPPTWWGSA